MTNTSERLQKVIAKSGLTSRRKAEQYILDGRVKVNDELVTTLGTKVTSTDKVTVDDVPLDKEAPVYYMLYKPQGVISSVKDDKGRRVVTDYLSDIEERIFPIGRLDYHTSGLLLLTNDGEFANMLMHPSHRIDKVYIAKIKGIPRKNMLKSLQTGISSDNEKLVAKDSMIRSSNRKDNTSIVQLTLHEGKNRQVRRMLEAIGHEVIKLKRESYGFLTLHGLNAGDYRPLKPHEVKRLREMALKNVKQ